MDNASPTTEHPTPPPGGHGPRVTRDEMKDLGRLRRSVTDRHIGGVAGGLARHLDIDPIILRVAFVVAVFFGGAGILAYVGAWALVPEEGTNDEPLGLDQRSRTIALGGVGVLALLCAVGDWAGAFWFPWPLAILGAIVLWVLNRNKDRDGWHSFGSSAPAAPGAPAAAATPGGETTATETSYDPAAQPSYDHGQASYSMRPVDYSRPRLPRNPRKRGPILFFFTLALIALAEGILGVTDLAGADFADSSYPALALGIITVMLLVGAFWGRAGGLIALGVIAAIATLGATLGSQFPDEDITYTPTSASEVRENYDIGGGEALLDFSQLSDVDALDGREVNIDGVGGRIEVIVPDGVDVSVQSEVVAGDLRVFDQRQDGIDVQLDGFRDGGDDVPDMTINIDLFVGEVIVREAA